MAGLEEIIIELSNAFGPSGFENEVREIFRKMVAECTEITHDNLGSIIATHHGKTASPKILLAAHLDEVGLMVRGITPGGYLKTVPLGSWWPPTLLGQRVLVRSKNGDYYGAVGAKPPHYLGEEERNRPLKLADLYIDVGARNSDEVNALGIEVGDPVVPAVKTEKLGPSGALMGKAFDDRAGCAVIARVLQELDQNHPNQVIGAGTAQEENGLKGAKTVAAVVHPDLCLVLEGTPADDFPGASDIIQGKLGGGPQIRFFDPTLTPNQALVRSVIATAGEMGIPYQLAVRESGGTDGKEIQQSAAGVPTIVIGVPVRYAHSHQCIMSLNDLEATVKLVLGLINVLDEAKVNDLKRNPW
ncbi:MAG: M42 family metallopeptidase [Bacteroidota bacterium]